jgi:hypothetical protein
MLPLLQAEPELMPIPALFIALTKLRPSKSGHEQKLA